MNADKNGQRINMAILDKYWKARREPAEHVNQIKKRMCIPGPIRRLEFAAIELNWRWTAPHLFITSEGVKIKLYDSQEENWCKHKLRSELRTKP